MELSSIKGVGAVTLEKLNALGIYSVGSLLGFLPSKYVDLQSPVPVRYAEDGQFCLIEGLVISVSQPSFRGKKSFNVTFEDCFEGEFDNRPYSQSKIAERFTAVFFNQPYLVNTIETGAKFRLLAKIIKSDGRVSLVNPIYERIEKLKLLSKSVFTVYPLKGIIGQKQFKNLLSSALDLVGKYGNQSELVASLRGAHFPKDAIQCRESIFKLASIDLACGLVQYEKSHNTVQNERKVFYNIQFDRILDCKSYFDFELTESQQEAVERIFADLNSGKNMSRIVSGDVGSGKTAVAYAAIYFAASAGYQSAYMCPTEILARQQYRKFNDFAKKCGVRAALLTSSTPTAERKEILSGLKSGDIDVIFGTQSLVGKSVDYHVLTLGIIDEQHRFGVGCRAELENKGACDILTLTATPIPRTLALTVYNKIAVSSIKKRESATTNISTRIVDDSKLLEMLKYIKGECENGKQAFIVCSTINDSEGFEAYSLNRFQKDYFAFFDNLTVSILHGRMTSECKNCAMNDFSEGRVDVLAATSLIEVGIDTKASIIAILNADRFGLASLHQLRGRVGRDGSSAYCFLHAKSPGEKAFLRLKALETISDGALLAEEDLKMRGAGELLGAKQSGATLSPILSLPLTFNSFVEARQIADNIQQSGDTADFNSFSELFDADYQAFIDSLNSVTLNS